MSDADLEGRPLMAAEEQEGGFRPAEVGGAGAPATSADDTQGISARWVLLMLVVIACVLSFLYSVARAPPKENMVYHPIRLHEIPAHGPPATTTQPPPTTEKPSETPPVEEPVTEQPPVEVDPNDPFVDHTVVKGPSKKDGDSKGNPPSKGPAGNTQEPPKGHDTTHSHGGSDGVTRQNRYQEHYHPSTAGASGILVPELNKAPEMEMFNDYSKTDIPGFEHDLEIAFFNPRMAACMRAMHMLPDRWEIGSEQWTADKSKEAVILELHAGQKDITTFIDLDAPLLFNYRELAAKLAVFYTGAAGADPMSVEFAPCRATLAAYFYAMFTQKAFWLINTHPNSVAAKSVKFFLYSSSKYGLGNRLRSVKSAFLFSVVTGRVMLLEWYSPTKYTELFRYPLGLDYGLEYWMPGLHAVGKAKGLNGGQCCQDDDKSQKHISCKIPGCSRFNGFPGKDFRAIKNAIVDGKLEEFVDQRGPHLFKLLTFSGYHEWWEERFAARKVPFSKNHYTDVFVLFSESPQGLLLEPEFTKTKPFPNDYFADTATSATSKWQQKHTGETPPGPDSDKYPVGVDQTPYSGGAVFARTVRDSYKRVVGGPMNHRTWAFMYLFRPSPVVFERLCQLHAELHHPSQADDWLQDADIKQFLAYHFPQGPSEHLRKTLAAWQQSLGHPLVMTHHMRMGSAQTSHFPYLRAPDMKPLRSCLRQTAAMLAYHGAPIKIYGTADDMAQIHKTADQMPKGGLLFEKGAVIHSGVDNFFDRRFKGGEERRHKGLHKVAVDVLMTSMGDLSIGTSGSSFSEEPHIAIQSRMVYRWVRNPPPWCTNRPDR